MVDLDEPALRDRIADEVARRARRDAQRDPIGSAVGLGLLAAPIGVLVVVMLARGLREVGVTVDGPLLHVLLGFAMSTAVAWWRLELRQQRRCDEVIAFSRRASLAALLDWLPMDAGTSPEAREAFTLMQQRVRARDAQRRERQRAGRTGPRPSPSPGGGPPNPPPRDAPDPTTRIEPLRGGGWPSRRAD